MRIEFFTVFSARMTMFLSVAFGTCWVYSTVQFRLLFVLVPLPPPPPEFVLDVFGK